jgi:hypothetical protein
MRFIEDLLPVIDAFELAKDQIKPESEGEIKIDASYQVRRVRWLLKIAPPGAAGDPQPCRMTSQPVALGRVSVASAPLGR